MSVIYLKKITIVTNKKSNSYLLFLHFLIVALQSLIILSAINQVHGQPVGNVASYSTTPQSQPQTSVVTIKTKEPPFAANNTTGDYSSYAVHDGIDSDNNVDIDVPMSSLSGSLKDFGLDNHDVTEDASPADVDIGKDILKPLNPHTMEPTENTEIETEPFLAMELRKLMGQEDSHSDEEYDHVHGDATGNIYINTEQDAVKEPERRSNPIASLLERTWEVSSHGSERIYFTRIAHLYVKMCGRLVQSMYVVVRRLESLMAKSKVYKTFYKNTIHFDKEIHEFESAIFAMEEFGIGRGDPLEQTSKFHQFLVAQFQAVNKAILEQKKDEDEHPEKPQYLSTYMRLRSMISRLVLSFDYAIQKYSYAYMIKFKNYKRRSDFERRRQLFNLHYMLHTAYTAISKAVEAVKLKKDFSQWKVSLWDANQSLLDVEKETLVANVNDDHHIL